MIDHEAALTIAVEPLDHPSARALIAALDAPLRVCFGKDVDAPADPRALTAG